MQGEWALLCLTVVLLLNSIFLADAAKVIASPPKRAAATVPAIPFSNAKAFSARHYYSRNYLNGQTIRFQSVIANPGGGYNPGLSTYYVPSSGYYQIFWSLLSKFGNYDSSAYLVVRTSGGTFLDTNKLGRVYWRVKSNTYVQSSMQQIRYLGKGYRVYIRSVGTTETHSSTGAPMSFFSGHKIN